MDFNSRVGSREDFATSGPQNTNKCEIIAQGKFFPTAIFSVLCVAQSLNY